MLAMIPIWALVFMIMLAIQPMMPPMMMVQSQCIGRGPPTHRGGGDGAADEAPAGGRRMDAATVAQPPGPLEAGRLWAGSGGPEEQGGAELSLDATGPAPDRT